MVAVSFQKSFPIDSSLLCLHVFLFLFSQRRSVPNLWSLHNNVSPVRDFYRVLGYPGCRAPPSAYYAYLVERGISDPCPGCPASPTSDTVPYLRFGPLLLKRASYVPIIPPNYKCTCRPPCSSSVYHLSPLI